MPPSSTEPTSRTPSTPDPSPPSATPARPNMAGRCSAPSRRRGHVGRNHEALSAESPLGAFGAAVPGGRHRAGGPGIPAGTSAHDVLHGLRSGPAVWLSPRLAGPGPLWLTR